MGIMAVEVVVSSKILSMLNLKKGCYSLVYYNPDFYGYYGEEEEDKYGQYGYPTLPQLCEEAQFLHVGGGCQFRVYEESYGGQAEIELG